MKTRFGRFNKDGWVIEEVAFTVPDPTMLHIDPLGTIIGEGALNDRKVEKYIRITYHVICSTWIDHPIVCWGDKTCFSWIKKGSNWNEFFKGYGENSANSSIETEIVLPFWFVAILAPLLVWVIFSNSNTQNIRRIQKTQTTNAIQY